MTKNQARVQSRVALNFLDLAHSFPPSRADRISFQAWWDQFASDSGLEAARGQWKRWKNEFKEHGIPCEYVDDGRKSYVVLMPKAIEIAEDLHAKARANLDKGKKEPRAYPDFVTIAGKTYRLKVYGRSVRPLTDREYEDLRASIAEKGRVEVNVFVDPDGNVVDGEHRLMIAEELGLTEVPVVVVENRDRAALDDMAVQLNSCRRQLTKKDVARHRRERRERAKSKRAERKSIRQIARDEGVDTRTIQRDLASADQDPDAKVQGSDGCLRPAKKTSAEKRAVRRQRIAELLAEDEDLTVRELTKALGVSRGTVQRDLDALAAATSGEPTNGSDQSGIVAQMFDGSESWSQVDAESDPLVTCLQAAVDGLEEIRGRVQAPGVADLVDAVRQILDSAVWRLMEEDSS